MNSLKRLAAYYLSYPSEYSALRDLFGYERPPRTLSLRERMRFLEGFADQRKALIEAWIADWKQNGIGPPGDTRDLRKFKEVHERTFRRMAAGLMAIKDLRHFGEQYDPAPPADFTDTVDEWITDEFRPAGLMGSLNEWWKPASEKLDVSRDMVMKEIVSLLYVFRDDKELLSDDACFTLLDKAFRDYLDEEFGVHLKYQILVPDWVWSLFVAFVVGGPSLFGAHAGTLGEVGKLAVRLGAPFIAAIANGLYYPETENHVLMAYSSIHLARQWVKRNPRQDARLEAGRYARIKDGLLDEQIEDFLLQAAGRVVHNGFFETNARPYQAFSLHPLMNLFSFAEPGRIRTAAGNALDYASSTAAFRSWQGRKDGRATVGPMYSPFRRNYKSADDVSIYGTEAVMMPLLGEPPWESSYWASHPGNPAGFALWAVLLGYRPHEIVTDFAVKEHLFAANRGYWARAHARYTLDHYRVHERPGYFEPDGRTFREGAGIRSVPETWFVTKDFMNAGGGRFDRYDIFGDRLLSLKEEPPPHTQQYDFIARPQVAFVDKGFFEFEGEDKAEKRESMRSRVMFSFGHRDFWISDNSGIYKGFTYCYFKHRDRDDRHSDFPMNIPPAWLERRLEENGEHVFRNSSTSRVVFSFFDVGEEGTRGPYVVIGRASKSSRRRRYRAYARGFWELVPGHRFDSLAALKDWVLEHNPDEHFSNTTEGERRHYLYTMTTGETVQLNDLLGHGWSDRRNRWVEVTNPVRNIWPRGAEPLVDPPLRLGDVLLNHESQDDVNAMPLLQVAEVDEAFNFTGRLFAGATGNGLLRVTNPFLNYELIIDSRDYRSPARSGRILE